MPRYAITTPAHTAEIPAALLRALLALPPSTRATLRDVAYAWDHTVHVRCDAGRVEFDLGSDRVLLSPWGQS